MEGFLKDELCIWRGGGKAWCFLPIKHTHTHTHTLNTQNSLLPSCPLQPGITSAICPPPSFSSLPTPSFHPPPPPLLLFLFFLQPPAPPSVHFKPPTFTLWWHVENLSLRSQRDVFVFARWTKSEVFLLAEMAWSSLKKSQCLCFSHGILLTFSMWAVLSLLSGYR